jgi:hypothetical protein
MRSVAPIWSQGLYHNDSVGLPPTPSEKAAYHVPIRISGPISCTQMRADAQADP